VVVRVEPLGHLERGVVALAARDGEVPGEVEAPVRVGERREPGRHGPEGRRDVEHLVVERERAGHGRVVGAEAEVDEPAQRGEAQVARRRLELVGARAPGPERLDGLLQLATAPDAGVAEHGAGREVGRGG